MNEIKKKEETEKDLITGIEQLEEWSENDFKKWYNYRPISIRESACFTTKELTFEHFKKELFEQGLPYKYIWWKDYIIWKLSQ